MSERYAAVRAALEHGLRIERVLQEHDEGMVYLARDLALDRPVLVRALVPALAGPERTSQFVRFMKTLASLSDSHLPALHYAHLDGDVRFAVLEHAEGETLERRLARGPLPSSEIHRLGVHLLRALEAAHAAGFLHAAIVSGNVLLSDGGYRLDGFGGAPASAEGIRADLDAVGRLLGEAAGAAPDRRVRKVLSRRPPTAAAFREALETVPAPAVTLPRRWRWRSPAVALGVGAIGLLLLGGGAAPLGPVPRELAILPLEVDAGQPLDPLGANIAQLVQLDLEGLPDLALTSRAQVDQWRARQPEGMPLDGASAARALRVHWVAHGLVERRPGDSLRVRLSLYDSSGTSSVLREVRGPGGHLAGIGDSISLDILRVVAPRSVALYDPVSGFAGVPLPALKAFLQGEAAFAVDSWALAQRSYEAALDLDSAFALAEWRLANVKHWRRVSREPDLADLYRRHAARFRQSDRRLIEALLEPNLDLRFLRLENEVRRRPGDGYARLLQGEELFHRGPLVGRGMDEALAAMSAAVARDSSLAIAYDHIVLGDIRLGRRADARSALSLRRRAGRAASAEDIDLVPFLELVYHERFAPRQAWARYQWIAWRRDPGTLEDIARIARIGTPWLDLPTTQLRYCDLLLSAGTPAADAYASAHEGRGLALFALGRLAESLAEIDSAAGLFDSPEARLQQAEWRVVSRAVGLPLADSVNWEPWLAGVAEDSALGGRAVWALALARLSHGDTAGARRWAERLPPRAPLRVLIDAGRAAAAGDFSLALGLSDSVRVSFSATQPPDPFSITVFHLLRGDWFVASGDSGRAQREWMWHEASDIEGWPVGLSRAAEVSAAFGSFARLRRGCGHLERVQELWSEADPTPRSLLVKASRRQECAE